MMSSNTLATQRIKYNVGNDPDDLEGYHVALMYAQGAFGAPLIDFDPASPFHQTHAIYNAQQAQNRGHLSLDPTDPQACKLLALEVKRGQFGPPPPDFNINSQESESQAIIIVREALRVSRRKGSSYQGLHSSAVKHEGVAASKQTSSLKRKTGQDTETAIDFEAVPIKQEEALIDLTGAPPKRIEREHGETDQASSHAVSPNEKAGLGLNESSGMMEESDQSSSINHDHTGSGLHEHANPQTRADLITELLSTNQAAMTEDSENEFGDLSLETKRSTRKRQGNKNAHQPKEVVLSSRHQLTAVDITSLSLGQDLIKLALKHTDWTKQEEFLDDIFGGWWESTSKGTRKPRKLKNPEYDSPLEIGELIRDSYSSALRKEASEHGKSPEDMAFQVDQGRRAGAKVYIKVRLAIGGLRQKHSFVDSHHTYVRSDNIRFYEPWAEKTSQAYTAYEEYDRNTCNISNKSKLLMLARHRLKTWYSNVEHRSEVEHVVPEDEHKFVPDIPRTQ